MKRTISMFLAALMAFCLMAPVASAATYYDVTVTVSDPSGLTVVDEQPYLPDSATLYGVLVQTYGTRSKDFEKFDAATRAALDSVTSANLKDFKDRVEMSFKANSRTTIGQLGVGTYVISDKESGIAISVQVALNTTGDPNPPVEEPKPEEPKPEEPKPEEPKPEEPAGPKANPFTDVKDSDYFYDPVLWAVEKNITKGTSDTTFGPNEACTRAQVVTFLWRAAGSPKAKSAANPFTDVKEGDYFYDAVLWAVEQDITKGTSDTTFGPGQPCTRAQVVTFLYRSQKSPEVKGANTFTDVKADDYFYSAVLWAVEKNITKGTSETTFSPSQTCVRAQIVTFLYRLLNV